MQLQEENISLKHVIYSENKVPFLYFQSTLCQQSKLGGSNKLPGGSAISIKLRIYIFIDIYI